MMAAGDQVLDRIERAEVGGGEAEVGRAHDLALAHREAARDLRQVFAEADLQDQPLNFAEALRLMQALGPGEQLRQGGRIGRKPGEAMGGELRTVEGGGVDLAAGSDPRGDGAARGFDDGLGGVEADVTPFQQVRQQRGSRRAVGSLHGHPCGHRQSSRQSSMVRRPGRLAWTSTAILPGLCWFFHIFMCAAGMSSQGKTSDMQGSMRRSTTR